MEQRLPVAVVCRYEQSTPCPMPGLTDDLADSSSPWLTASG